MVAWLLSSAVCLCSRYTFSACFKAVWTLVGRSLEEQSDQVLHCLFSYMRVAVVVGCSICSRHELFSACLLSSADPDLTDPRGTV